MTKLQELGFTLIDDFIYQLDVEQGTIVFEEFLNGGGCSVDLWPHGPGALIWSSPICTYPEACLYAQALAAGFKLA